jgi:hypothetical protein
MGAFIPLYSQIYLFFARPHSESGEKPTSGKIFSGRKTLMATDILVDI